MGRVGSPGPGAGAVLWCFSCSLLPFYQLVFLTLYKAQGMASNCFPCLAFDVLATPQLQFYPRGEMSLSTKRPLLLNLKRPM